MLKRYIGDRAFYRSMLAVALPIIIQNGITTFVGLLDNIMVGQVGTAQMSGVSVVNQLILVLNISLFGACAGAGIYIAQFYGSYNHEGIRHAFRFKLMICLVLALLSIGLFSLSGNELIDLFLQGEGDPAEATLTLQYGREYLDVMLWGFIPFALSIAYATTLRECGKTMLPMVSGVIAVFVNLILNYILIFGHFGAPALGIKGAAIATVISRYAELAIMVCWSHLHTEDTPFISGLYRSFYIPGMLLKKIMIKTAPLLINEFLWSTGMAFLNQCYSTCGLEVVAASNICSTLSNVASVMFIAMGSTTGIIMGQMLGAKRTEEELRDTNRKLLFTTVASGIVLGVAMASVSGVFPLLYNTTPQVRFVATQMIIAYGLIVVPLHSYLNPVYFTIRAGGKTLITFLYDSGFLWGVMIPAAYLLSRYTAIPILPLYIICNGLEALKIGISVKLLRKGVWIHNLASK